MAALVVVAFARAVVVSGALGTSLLRRAIRTACLVLSATNQCWLPMVKDSRLNEQHPGALTGYNKLELAKAHLLQLKDVDVVNQRFCAQFIVDIER